MRTLFLNFLFIFFTIIFVNAQVCFTYDNAGNRIKRQTCILSITNQENDEISLVSPELSLEQRSLLEGNDLSEIVIYPNPTSAEIQLKNQMEWLGASLKVVTNEGKLVNTVSITAEPIDFSYLSSGTYFLILSSNTSRRIAKLFITK